MKSSISFAVLLLIENASASEVYRHHHRPQQTSNVQNGAFIHNKLKEAVKWNDKVYPETKEARQWWELDDFTERINGSEEDDWKSPHDPEVVDAPEDMKRVGNDHEDLHNAKLSPDGYYNGFHHKDFEGKYVQKSNKQSFAQRPHHRRSLVQLSDHDNDDDDVLEEGTYVSYEHENDTEDLSELVDPINQNLLFLKMQEQDHFNDSDDIPVGEVESISQRGTAQKRMDNDVAWEQFYVKSAESLKAEDDLKEDQWDQANKIPDMPSTKYLQHADSSLLQLSYNHISHADDTEDIADEVNPSNYDIHHSKEWNNAVEKKAEELENEMKIEDNMKISKKNAKEDAKKKAIESKAKAEAEKRKKAQELAEVNTHKAQQSTIDLMELYKDMPNETLLQTGWEDNNHLYSHHSDEFYKRVDEEIEENDQQQLKKQKEESENIYHYKTMNPEQMYDGIMLQTGYESHSDNYYKVENEQNSEWDNIEANYQKTLEDQDKARKALAEGTATPEQLDAQIPDVHHTNPFVKDLDSLYDGIQMVQISDHVNDQDDLVPEFSEEIKEPLQHVRAEEKHYDFEGKEIQETYDE